MFCLRLSAHSHIFLKPDEETTNIRSYNEGDNITDELAYKRQKAKRWRERTTHASMISKVVSVPPKTSTPPTPEPNPSNSPSLRDIYKSFLSIPPNNVGNHSPSPHNTFKDMSPSYDLSLQHYASAINGTERSPECSTTAKTNNDIVTDNIESSERISSALQFPLQHKASNPQVIRTNTNNNNENNNNINNNNMNDSPFVDRSLSFKLKEGITTQDRNWNEEIMLLVDRIYTSNDVSEKCQITHQLLNLVKEFQDFAITEAKVIIDEIGLPTEQKTIKPVNLGGVAGGQKYIHGGIFFKLAIDVHDMYGGDMSAAKTATRELQGLRCYLEAEVPGLCVPLFIVIDYRGFRITAEPMLPIGKDTLVYGSNDGGVTVVKKNKEMAKKMRLAAERINLNKHSVGNVIRKKIFGPGDIEGHLGKDNRFYVLDAARLLPAFPPKKSFWAYFLPQDDYLQNRNLWQLISPPVAIEIPWNPREKSNWKKILRRYFSDLDSDEELCEVPFPFGIIFLSPQNKRRQINAALNRKASEFLQRAVWGDAVVVMTLEIKGHALYTLMRPEFVRRWRTPLSSDAFTFFQTSDSQKRKDKNNIIEAATYLLETAIPSFVQKLTNREVEITTANELFAAMHQHGINYRLLGKIYTRVQNNFNLKRLVLDALVKRTVKIFLNVMFRRMIMKEVTVACKCILPYYNLVFGQSSASTLFWSLQLKFLIGSKYGADVLSSEEMRIDYDHRQFINKFELLELTKEKVGVVWKTQTMTRLRENVKLFDVPNPLSSEDFLTVACSAKNNYYTYLNNLLNRWITATAETPLKT